MQEKLKIFLERGFRWTSCRPDTEIDSALGAQVQREIYSPLSLDSQLSCDETPSPGKDHMDSFSRSATCCCSCMCSASSNP